MKEKIIFISKDALRCDALSCYGSMQFKQPNIDALAAKGTVYKQYYTAGGSTAMAFTAMATGQYLFASGRKLYDGSEGAIEGYNFFDDFYDHGYSVHIAWDDSYTSFAKTHFNCEGKHTKIHSLKSIIPHHTAHVTGQFDDLSYKDEELRQGLELVEKLFDEIAAIEGKVFLWFHLPHVFRGRNSYDSDLDVFDHIIGMARERWDDDSIWVSADHGQMNGQKGKFSYGYDVEDRVMRIPLIAPRTEFAVDYPISNTQLAGIFGLKPLEPQKFVYCETAYYAQPMRKMAIIHGRYKLVYDKYVKRFFLYDLEWDKTEDLNLFYPEFFDTDRRVWYSLNQRFYYPHWDEAHKEKEILLEEWKRVWHNGTFFEELKQKLKFFLRVVYMKYKSTPKTIINIGK